MLVSKTKPCMSKYK